MAMLNLRVQGCLVGIDCACPELLDLLRATFASEVVVEPVARYDVAAHIGVSDQLAETETSAGLRRKKTGPLQQIWLDGVGEAELRPGRGWMLCRVRAGVPAERVLRELVLPCLDVCVAEIRACQPPGSATQNPP